MDIIAQIRQSDLFLIAGPCSAESEEQSLAAARGVAAAGASVFRAGLWKPRTRPGSFEGVGAQGLPWLRKIHQEVGLPVITEIATPEHLQQVVEAGIDGVWIGARTTANPFAMQLIADAFAALPENVRASMPVFVKNPVNPDLELWEGAIDRLKGAGVNNIVAVHRGFSAYGESRYRNAPMWRIPFELRRRRPDLPIICDPSHIAGRSELVEDVCRHAVDLGLDGLIIESHCNPEAALSDAAQQITPTQLKDLIVKLSHTGDKKGADELLNDYREAIDALDSELMDILAKRMAIARDIGRIKRSVGMKVLQPGRYKNLIEKRIADCRNLQLDASFVKNILAAIHEESVRQQLNEI